MRTRHDADQLVLEEHLANRVLLVTQVVFFSCVGLCLLINHGEMAENDGISFYGVYHSTVEILVVGYVVAALGLWRIAHYFKLVGLPSFTVLALRLVGVGLFALLLTPYNKGAFFNWSHMIVGITGALLQLEIALQLLSAPPFESRDLRAQCAARGRPHLCRVAPRLALRVSATGGDYLSNRIRGESPQWSPRALRRALIHASRMAFEFELEGEVAVLGTDGRVRQHVQRLQPIFGIVGECMLAFEGDLTKEERVPNPSERQGAHAIDQEILIFERLHTAKDSSARFLLRAGNAGGGGRIVFGEGDAFDTKNARLRAFGNLRFSNHYLQRCAQIGRRLHVLQRFREDFDQS